MNQRQNLREIGRVEQCPYCGVDILVDDTDMDIICCESSSCIGQAQREYCS